MTNKEQKILSRWETTKRYLVDMEQKEDIETSVKMIIMQIIKRDDREVLNFNGGPTGHESYCLDDFTCTPEATGDFCICAGTPNRWPACFVNKKTVCDFVAQYKAAKAIS